MSIPLAAIAMLLASLAGCKEEPLSGAPTTPLGEAICAACEMNVREDRYSAGAVVTIEEKRQHLSFDDIGCLLDHERFHPEIRFHEWFVRDAASGRWVDAPHAHFVHSDSIHTPMASGIAAFADAAAAQEAATKAGATVQAWPEIRAARQKWMEERYGKPAR
ncbi:MAG TPA: nitrous oxide reductase accessory protein NosL [Phycisphaerales bacterium]|nr:nitrous oxide reductase accessory protein NosL [Phycisphaerales bacterium]